MSDQGNVQLGKFLVRKIFVGKMFDWGNLRIPLLTRHKYVQKEVFILLIHFIARLVYLNLQRLYIWFLLDVRIMENRVDHTFPSMARSNSFSLFEIISTLNGLTAWLRGHPDVSHSDFAERVMYSSVELLNGILERRCMAPPEYLFIIQNFLNDSKQQEQLLLYVKSNSSSKCVQAFNLAPWKERGYLYGRKRCLTKKSCQEFKKRIRNELSKPSLLNIRLHG